MKKLLALTAAAACALALTACATTPAVQPASAPQQSTAMSGATSGAASTAASSQAATGGLFSSFTATDLDGNTVDATVLAGKKLTMINVWGTFCSPCLEEMPDLGAISTEYKDKDLQVIGIVIDALDSTGAPAQAQVDLAKQLVEQTGAAYLHLVPSKDMMQTILADVSAVPTTFFVDVEGNVVGEPHLGARSADEWKQIIDGLLATA